MGRGFSDDAERPIELAVRVRPRRYRSAMNRLFVNGRLARRAPTRGERTLWELLRRDNLGVRFRRQHVIDRFVVDFACLPARLIVEIDGPHHAEQRELDRERQEALEARGFTLLRFSSDAAERNASAIASRIQRELSLRGFRRAGRTEPHCLNPSP